MGVRFRLSLIQNIHWFLVFKWIILIALKWKFCKIINNRNESAESKKRHFGTRPHKFTA